jgi:soluble lytic murein transglycosylase-like protein
VNDLVPEVLTTYAGLFFRDLLDRFPGEVALAVGAYNGGPGNPNLQYEAGVRLVAEHARRVLEHAAALRDRPAAGMRFLTAGR